jgi:hypothetical protein
MNKNDTDEELKIKNGECLLLATIQITFFCLLVCHPET